MTSRARNNFLPDSAGGEARSIVGGGRRRPDKRCSARRTEFASEWPWFEPRPMAEAFWQTVEKRGRRDERRPAGPPRFPGRPFSVARWPGPAGRTSRVRGGWRVARAVRCGRRLTNQARSEPTTAGRFPNVRRRHQEKAFRPARGACAPGSFRADLRDGSLPNGPTIFAQSLRLRRRTSREFRAILRVRGCILTLPPAWASAGGAPVSDPAVPAQDRAMLPDRRPALRWWWCQEDAPGIKAARSGYPRTERMNANKNEIFVAGINRRREL